jgi:ribosomal protein S18 acetylase RimI-like enzyme
MIRPTTPEDTPALLEIARGTGVFKPPEIVALEEVLDDYHAGNCDVGHRALTLERGGRPIGFAYYAPAAMTDRTWYLWWIAVDRTIQARGLGSELLLAAEDEIHREDGRMILIETSSLGHYEPTRQFYLRHGYNRVAAIPDYYADGDDLVVYRKWIVPPGTPPG